MQEAIKGRLVCVDREYTVKLVEAIGAIFVKFNFISRDVAQQKPRVMLTRNAGSCPL